MQPVETANPRRDPAPSRWAYRMHRLWLTPLFRGLMRVGLPVFALVFGLGWVFSAPQNRALVTEQIAELRRSIAERPEFMVKLMAIDGASTKLAAEVRQLLPIDFPLSSFDLDLEAMQGAVEELDAVAAADLRIRPGGILQVEVSERIPAVVWRIEGHLELLDAEGRRVAPLMRRGDRTDLPLIAGAGGDGAVPEALALIAAAGPLNDRLRGLVRMGERRWDVVLDRDQRILLPEDESVAALERVIALDQARDLLARDLSVVDLRNPRRPTLRMAPRAVEELRRIKALERGDDVR
ncbi:MAG: cell division protein FtsQ/DivIB [Rhodobacter sp.]|nr:cell division protein FtsQ/DivIB [Rhodobacter sp.]